MTNPRPPRITSTLALGLVLLVALLAAPDPVDAQAPSAIPNDPQASAPGPNNGPSAAAGAADGGQSQTVSTSGGTFWNSVGYLMVFLLAAGGLYAVCRSSHRT